MYNAGDVAAGSTVQIPFSTNAVAGESVTIATNGNIRIYKGSSTTERSSSSGVTFSEDFDSMTGAHMVAIDLSDNDDAGFYAAGNNYFVVLQGATIDGKAINSWIGAFSIENRSALRPTTAGRTLDVTAGGAAGVDWGNVENKTTSNDLSGTTISTSQAVASVSGAVGSVTGNVGGNVSGSIGSLANQAKADVNAEVDSALADYDAPTKAELDSGLDALPTAAENRAEMDSNSTQLAAIVGDTNELQTDWANGGRLDLILDARASQSSVDDLPTNSELTTALGGLNDLDATEVQTAAAAALTAYDPPTKAELDSGLDALPTAAENAAALMDLSNGVETSITPRQALRLILAAAAGKLSGAATTTITIRNVGDSKDRITATVDENGNRSAVTLDAT